MADEPGQDEKPPETAPTQPVKKRPKVPLEVRERNLAPKPSFWPIILAFTLIVAFIGVMVNPIIFAIGVVLVIAAIIGWMLEKH